MDLGVLSISVPLQNSQCRREVCTFYHGTVAEEAQYRATGILPARPGESPAVASAANQVHQPPSKAG